MDNISILSIAFVAIGVLFLIIGLAKGFARQFRGLSWLIALAGGVVAAILILPTVTVENEVVTISGNFYTYDWFANIWNSINNALSGKLGTHSGTITNICFGIVIWLVTFIVVKYLLKLITLIFVKLADLPVIKIFDRVLGAIFAVAVAYVIFVGLIYPGVCFLCHSFGNNVAFLNTVGEWIKNQAKQDVIITFINETNVIGNMVVGGLDVFLGIAAA